MKLNEDLVGQLRLRIPTWDDEKTLMGDIFVKRVSCTLANSGDHPLSSSPFLSLSLSLSLFLSLPLYVCVSVSFSIIAGEVLEQAIPEWHTSLGLYTFDFLIEHVVTEDTADLLLWYTPSYKNTIKYLNSPNTLVLVLCRLHCWNFLRDMHCNFHKQDR